MGIETTPLQARTVVRQDNEPADTGALWLDTKTEPPTLKQYSDSGGWNAIVKGGSPVFGNGNDGVITEDSDTTRGGYIYPTSYTVEEGVTVTVPQSEGALIVFARDKITINGTIDATGAGGSGGSPGSTEPEVGRLTPAQSGLGGTSDNPDGTNGGGGYSYAGGAADPPQDAPAKSGPPLSQLNSPVSPHFGDLISLPINAASGGGAGGKSNDFGTGGSGGDGGGLIYLLAPEVELNGSLIAAGTDGQNGGSNAAAGDHNGGGGGGVGGVVGAFTPSLKNNGTVDVSGGLAGVDPTGESGDGGDGPPGEVLL